MPVLKNKTQGNYVNVYKGIAMDHSLNLKDRGMMLTLLSLPDNWDFTVAGLRKILPDGKAAIYKSLDSLQAAGYLTKQQCREEGGMFGKNMLEVHETPCPPFPRNRVPDKREAEKPVSDYRTQVNNKEVSNKQVKHKKVNNQSIYQQLQEDEVDRIENYKEQIKVNIEYEVLLNDNPYQEEIIQEILNLIVEIVAVKRKTVRIACTDYPYELVKGKFLKLNMSHIQYVLSCMDKNTNKVQNIKNYLLTALYNAPNTMGNYYRSEVNHDMYGGV